MKTSQRGIDFIKKWEGVRLNAYRCPAGVLTIGYGHTKNVTEGQTISQYQAEELLKQDLVQYENYVNDLPYYLNQNQFDALVSFTFNCGKGNLDNLTQRNTRTLDEIATKMLLYNKANGKTLVGLQNRRKEEYELFREDTYKSDRLNEYNSLVIELTNIKNQLVIELDEIIRKYGG